MAEIAVTEWTVTSYSTPDPSPRAERRRKTVVRSRYSAHVGANDVADFAEALATLSPPVSARLTVETSDARPVRLVCEWEDILADATEEHHG